MTMHSLQIFAPLSGPVLSLEQVPDPVFSQKMVGDGLAIDPIDSVLRAPCSGRVIQLHSAHHALTIQTPDGVQILMHVGLETVNLKGEGFKPLIKAGDFVTTGQELLRFDSDLIARKAKSLITVIVVTEPAAGTSANLQKTTQLHAQSGRDILFTITNVKTTPSSDNQQNQQTEQSPSITIHLANGLHARPSALFIAQAKRFQSTIHLHKDSQRADAKSLVGILGLEIASHERVHLTATGTDAKEAVRSLTSFLSSMKEEPESPPPTVAATSANAASADPNILRGVSAAPGICVGTTLQMKAAKFDVQEQSTSSPKAERLALEKALHESKAELTQLTLKSPIFAAHQELLEDPTLVGEAVDIIEKGKSAAFAWQQITTTHAERLAHLKNELMAQRAADLRDVGARVLRHILPTSSTTASAAPAMPLPRRPNTILIAESLTPSETVALNREDILGFCTTSGGATSHVAILARSLGLPALAGTDIAALNIPDGTEVILDGDNGQLRLSPTATEKHTALARQREQRERAKVAFEQAQTLAHTKDGRRIEVAANIGGVTDAREAVSMGAEGVGLLRSEFLFLERDTAPSEDEQLQVYQQIADILKHRPLVIRTLDVGGDKPLQYMPLGAEENPFLGIRGLRVGLQYPDILREQLRAILRVRSEGPLHIMFPMVAMLSEWRAAKKMVQEECARLNRSLPSLGIMIEIPSAALIADAFAREVDFFSIGTNDLTQYTLAMDRGHQALAKYVDSLHPSILKLIEMTVAAAHRHGKWVGVCGGLASDLRAVPILIGLGVDELSVSIPSIPVVKAEVRKFAHDQARKIADEALTL